jgi:hypothetical protein
LLQAFAAKARTAEGQFQRLKSTLNKLKSLKFQSYMHRPTVSKGVRQYFIPLKTAIQKVHPPKASEH